FLLVQGLETLHVRIERHNENALKVAQFLQDHPGVEWVNFPGLKEHPSHALANKYFDGGYGSIITFGIKGGLEAGKTLIDNIELWSHVANVGDAKSLIIHPASTTHQQLSPEALEKSGVNEELVRLAIGIEDIADIIGTLDTAIEKATGHSAIEQSDEGAIAALFASPFDRSEGLRQKVIVVDGSDALQTAVQALQKRHYIVTDVNNAPDTIDAVVTDKSELDQAAIADYEAKGVSIIFAPQIDALQTEKAIHSKADILAISKRG